MTRLQRRAFVLFLILSVSLGLVAVSTAARPGAEAAKTYPVSRGSLDADVRLASGRVIGQLHGSIHRRGRGQAKFQPVHGSKRLAEIVGLRVKHVHGRERIVARAPGLRLTLRISRRNGLRGSGRIKGKRIRVAGAGGERSPDLRAGMRMLVIGHPRGEAYEALRHRFRPVRYSARRHARHRLLKERREFHRYAAIVFGPDVSARRIRRNRLLHMFYGAGRWVILAPAAEDRLAAISTVHPYVVRSAAQAIAVRAVGAQGHVRASRPTILYPRRPSYPRYYRTRTPDGRRSRVRLPQPSRSRLGREKRARQRRFLANLGAEARAYRSLSGPRTAQSSGGGPVTVPDGSAVIHIPITQTFQKTFLWSGSKSNFVFCGYKRGKAWCPGSDFYDYYDGPDNDLTAACQNFVATGYTLVNRSAVFGKAGKDGSIAYNGPDDNQLVVQKEGSDNNLQARGCPTLHAQHLEVDVQDDYYAFIEKEDAANVRHSLAVAENTTIRPELPGEKVINYPNGSAEAYLCEYAGPQAGVDCLNGDGTDPFQFVESFYLGGYDRSVTLSPGEKSPSTPQFGDPTVKNVNAPLIIDAGHTGPGTLIGTKDKTASSSVDKGWSVGIFGDQGTATYNSSTSMSASVTSVVPDWQVAPVTNSYGTRSESWNWRNNDPVKFDTNFGFDRLMLNPGQPFAEDNDWNTVQATPVSIVTWSGAPLWGKVNVESSRTAYMVDHYTFFNENAPDHPVQDAYQFDSLSIDAGPDTFNDNLPADAVGPGINFCDPEIRFDAFLPRCGGSTDALVTLTATCEDAAGSFTDITVNRTNPHDGNRDQTNKVPCNGKAYASIPTKTPVTIRFTPPDSSTGSITCKDASDTSKVLAGPSASPGFIGSASVTARRQIACTLTATGSPG